MPDPQTNLHYAPNANFVGDTYAPGAYGFNLVDASSVSRVNAMPAGVKALVYLGYEGGDTATFRSMVAPFIGNPNVYGFYLADEPGPGLAAQLQAESDYIHSVDPGAKSFMVLENNGTPTSPSYSYNPANTHMDLFGLDPYPIRPQFTGGANYAVIGDAVMAAESEGIPQSQLVPVYQAFGATSGAYASWTMPTPAQEQTILSTWGQYTPTPAFDYAYSWGTQSGDTALSTDPAVAAVFAAHNAVTPPPPPPPPPPPTTATMTATARHGPTVDVPVISSGSSITKVGTGTVSQSVSASGVDTVSSTRITSETLQLGSGTTTMKFVGDATLVVTGGSGSATITAGSGNDTFVAGTGSLTATGGLGRDSYVYHAGAGLLTINDFSLPQDMLSVDRSLQGSLMTGSDGHGGTLISFGSAAGSIDLVGVSSVSQLHIIFIGS